LNKYGIEIQQLTPKGLNVPGVTKPVLVSVASPHTIFRFFETFCEDASRNKHRASANFMILGAMVQKLWVFEVFGQGLAMAGMCWSQPARVDHFHKMWRAWKKKNSKKNRQYNPIQVSTRGQRATTSRWLAVVRHLDSVILLKFFYFLKCSLKLLEV
jgi:hypothetical protein